MAKITFAELTASNTKAGQKTAKRTPESKSLKAIEVVTNGVTFCGDTSLFAERVVAGEAIEFDNGHTVTADKPETAACALCGQTHGVKGGNGRIVDADNFARTLVFLQPDGSPLFIGNSGRSGCYEKYLAPAIKAHSSKVNNLSRLNSVTGSNFPTAQAAAASGADKGDKQPRGNQPKSK